MDLNLVIMNAATWVLCVYDCFYNCNVSTYLFVNPKDKTIHLKGCIQGEYILNTAYLLFQQYMKHGNKPSYKLKVSLI